MCLVKNTATAVAQPAIIPATTNRDSQRQGDLEARLRQLRGGAAANILTSPRGIPATNTLGGVPNAA